MFTFLIGLLITFSILSILVLIHELGHFIAAKKMGIKIEEFGFGFPLTKALFQVKRGETLYSFYPVLIGGFVKLYGEDEAGGGKISVKASTDKSLPETAYSFKGHYGIGNAIYEEMDRAFFARPVSQRALVVVAGVIMNAVLAFLIYYIFLGMSGFKTELPLLNDHKFFAVNQTNKLNTIIVNDVSKDSPAEKAGIKKCDQNFCAAITGINDIKPESSEEFIEEIKKNSGKEITLTIENQVGKKEKFKATLVPRANPPEGEGALGIAFSMLETTVLSYSSPIQKLFSGITHPLNLMSYNFDVMKTLIVKAIAEKDAAPLSAGVSGPVGIVRLGSELNKISDLKGRFLSFLNLAGLLSISLAVFNVLPIPALDGGRLFFILVEGVTRKKVSPRIEAAIHTVGMVVLLGLIVLVTFKDILQAF